MTDDTTDIDELDWPDDKHDILGEDTFDDDHCERVVEEVLGGVDYFEKAPGPDGPWYYRSLTVRRANNRILVYDVDERFAEKLVIPPAEEQVDDLHAALKEKLDTINEETLDAL